MIRATILLTFKDGRSFNYANRYLAEKTGNDGYKYGEEDRSTPLMSGIPGVCYYYTGLGTDTYDKQEGSGKAKTDYESLLGQIGKTGKVQFPEKTSSHEATDVIIRNYGESINNNIAQDRFSFNAADLVSVNLIETWIPYPGDDLDRNSRDRFPKNSPNYKGWQESKETPSKSIYEEGLGENFVKETLTLERNVGDKVYYVETNGIVPLPIISLGMKNEISIDNENKFKRVITKVSDYGVEAYGIVDIIKKQKSGKIDEKGAWVETEEYISVGEKKSGIVFKQFHAPIYKIEINLNYSSAPTIGPLYVEENSIINYGDIPVREGYTFLKWAVDKEGNTSAPERATEDITVYAIWKENLDRVCTYAELDTCLASLDPNKEYNIKVDTTGVSDAEFRGTGSSNQSPFGKKIEKSRSNKLNLTFALPETVTDASYMLAGNTKVKSVNVTSAKNVTDAGNMFYNCTGLTKIDTTAFTNITNASYMFSGCTGLTSIDTTAFTNVTDASDMFYNCTGLTKIDTSAFTNVKYANHMFYNCTGLTSITGTSAFINVTNAYGMFYNCSGLTSINTSAFTNVTDASYMFYNCTGLTKIDTTAFTNVTNAKYMFDSCTGLTSITGTSAFTNVTNANSMFANCSKLTSIDTSAFTNVKYANHMFYNCTGLTKINWGNIKPTNVTDMFSGASAQKTITVADAETQQFIESNKTTMQLDDRYTINVLQPTVQAAPVTKSVKKSKK